MNEQELKEFLKMVTPMLKELPEEEIKKQLDGIEMTKEEREQFLDIIKLLQEEENKG